MRLGLMRGSFNRRFQNPGIAQRRMGRLDKIFDEFEKLFQGQPKLMMAKTNDQFPPKKLQLPAKCFSSRTFLWKLLAPKVPFRRHMVEVVVVEIYIYIFNKLNQVLLCKVIQSEVTLIYCLTAQAITRTTKKEATTISAINQTPIAGSCRCKEFRLRSKPEKPEPLT